MRYGRHRHAPQNKEQRLHGRRQDRQRHAAPDSKATPPNGTRRGGSTASSKSTNKSTGASPDVKGAPSTRSSGSTAKSKGSIASAAPGAKGTPRTKSSGNEESKTKSWARGAAAALNKHVDQSRAKVVAPEAAAPSASPRKKNTRTGKRGVRRGPPWPRPRPTPQAVSRSQVPTRSGDAFA